MEPSKTEVTMAADLHIHVFTDEFTEEHYKTFSSNSIGSRFFRPEEPDYDKQFEKENGCNLYDLLAETPCVWIGEVSWLKAGLFNDVESFVPDAVMKINGLIDEDFPVIDDKFIKDVADALDLENATSYDLAKKEDVVSFLEEHKGKRVFTISW